MTDRDHFAAAALTGLLADPMESAKATDYVAAEAYEIADAMLRERERIAGSPTIDGVPVPPVPPAPVSRPSETRASFSYTTHDAAPAARATTKPGGLNSGCASGTSGDSSPVTMHGSGTGETQEPVAWAVVPRLEDEIDCEFVYSGQQDAAAVASGHGGVVAPLYRQPQPMLTGAERAAIEGAMWDYGQYADEMSLSVAEVKEKQSALRGLLERLGGAR
jgi:hypothetical protein